MSSRRSVSGRGEEAIRRRWESACDRMAFLKASQPTPVLAADPVLIRSLKGLVGREKAALREAMHAVLDRRILNAQNNQGAWMSGRPKNSVFAAPVEGLPLRLRLNDTKGTVLDVVGEGGALCDDDIVLDAVLPDTLIEGATGRRADAVIANPRGLFDGSRLIESGHIRFGRQTVLRLAVTTYIGVTYAELFGNPRRRYPTLQWPTASRGGFPLPY